MSNEHQPPPPPTQFGVFYPLGHVVIALQSRDDAERIRQLLLDGGYDEREVILWDSAQVATGAPEPSSSRPAFSPRSSALNSMRCTSISSWPTPGTPS